MGADAGFDLYPSLSKSQEDQRRWQKFIDHVKEFYQGDNRVVSREDQITIEAGEHPSLTLDGYRFRRFSSKITGSTAIDTNVESYLQGVTRLAKIYFGDQVHSWNELCDDYGKHNWPEVWQALDSHKQINDSSSHASSRVVDADNGYTSSKPIQSPCFEIKNVHGKGKGMVALCDIPVGKRIASEKPLFTIASGPPPEALEMSLALKLKSLDREAQRQFLSLHNHYPGKYPFCGIVKTNALPCGSGSTTGGVYPTLSYINHSCIPNAHHNWNSDEKHETIHAIQPIPRGSEITISYDHGGPSQERNSFLNASFGFVCTCSICSLPAVSLEASDKRRLLIQNLDNSIGDPIRMMIDPEGSLQDCYRLLHILQEEYIGNAGVLLARLYYDAFQICIAHGDRARAAAFAKEAYNVRLVCEGDDSPETARMQHFSSNPVTHPSHEAYSSRWKSKQCQVPQILDSDMLKEWLFRQVHVTSRINS